MNRPLRHRIKGRILRAFYLLGFLFCRRRGTWLGAGIAECVRSLYEGIDNVNFDMRINGELRVLTTLRTFGAKRFLDVGANVGEWSHHVLTLVPEAEIHLFEIVPETFSLLSARFPTGGGNLTLNAFGLSDSDDEVEIWLKGAGDSTATANRIPGFAMHLDPAVYAGCIRCKAMRADDYLAMKDIVGVDLVKIDVEGMELRVIKGFGPRLQNVRAVQFEYGIFNIGARALLADIWEQFQAGGFVVGKIFPNCVEFRDYHFELENFHGGNFVAVRSSEERLIAALRNTAVRDLA